MLIFLLLCFYKKDDERFIRDIQMNRNNGGNVNGFNSQGNNGLNASPHAEGLIVIRNRS